MDSPTKRYIEEFTVQIIASKNVENILQETFVFLKRYFPLDFINIPICDPKTGVLDYKVFITDDGVMFVDEKVKLSVLGQKEVINFTKEKIISIANTSRNPLTIDIAGHLGVKGIKSTLFVTTELSSSRYGFFGLVAVGENRYTDKHLEFMKNLFEPLSGIVRQVLTLLEIADEKERLIVENLELKKRLSHRIIGLDSGLKETMLQIGRVAPLDISVLLTGETGVGKEVFANLIHQQSARSSGPLISFNCGAIPESLLDSELFGYEKGAFTGATSMRRGYFEQADGGTVFMDEVGELSLSAQVKLLRILQHMEFQRVGGSRTISIDVRVVCATNRDLEKMVDKQQFRKDLWYRLNVFPVLIPPLRERSEDIPELARYFARKQAIEMNLTAQPVFAEDAMVNLHAYSWPGNIRELQNVIERALIINQGEPLSFSDLTADLSRSSIKKLGSQPEKLLTMNAMVTHHIKKSLVLSDGRVEGAGGAAELLDMNPSTLRGRMKKLGIK